MLFFYIQANWSLENEGNLLKVSREWVLQPNAEGVCPHRMCALRGLQNKYRTQSCLYRTSCLSEKVIDAMKTTWMGGR